MKKVEPQITGAYLNAETQKAALEPASNLPLTSETSVSEELVDQKPLSAKTNDQ